MSTVEEPLTQSSAEPTRAKDIMTRDVLSVYEGWSVKRLTEFFIKHSISGAPVIASDHSLVGVVSIVDVLRFENLNDQEKSTMIRQDVYPEYIGQSIAADILEQLAHNADLNCTVNTIMTPKVISVDQHATLKEVVTVLHEKNVRRVFVTNNGLIWGVISTGNVLKYLAEQPGFFDGPAS